MGRRHRSLFAFGNNAQREISLLVRGLLFSVVEPGPKSTVMLHPWPIMFFVFGCLVGSFLRLCIHRLPLEQPLFSPSVCPNCKASTPWLRHIFFPGWLPLQGRCQECAAPVPAGYFLIELLAGAAFLGCWLCFGPQSLTLALVYCLFLAGLIIATATDVKHLIIPDQITIGGMIVGIICSLLLPRLHGQSTWLRSLGESLLGLVLGGGGIYAILRGGKMVFGRERVKLPDKTKVVFGETSVHLPDREVPFEEVFSRKSDLITCHAETVELADRCYRDVPVRLSPEKLQIGNDTFKPEEVLHLEVVTAELVFPREAMGLGDAKLMAAIGAFLGAAGVLFTVVVGALAGSVYGLALIALRRRAWSGRLYFGPFLALGAAVWVFHGPPLVHWYLQLMQRFLAR
jgi:leader peptidase (prepilin peptidase) / N-methyltransferase